MCLGRPNWGKIWSERRAYVSNDLAMIASPAHEWFELLKADGSRISFSSNFEHFFLLKQILSLINTNLFRGHGATTNLATYFTSKRRPHVVLRSEVK